MPQISTLLLGDIERREFLGARAILESGGNVHCFKKVDAAAEALESSDVIPDIIVIAQSFPQQFSHQDVDRLRRFAPLARIVGLLGSWCEGESRSGHPWPAAVRIYWHQWDARARRELDRLIHNQCPSWGLPVTASEEERLLQISSHELPDRAGLIAIHARDFVTQDWLSEACRRWGHSTVWLRPPQSDCPDFHVHGNGTIPLSHIKGISAAIFDGGDLSDGELDQLRRLTNTLGKTPVIVLLDFPRIEDQQKAFAAKAAAVLSKPLNIDDLCWQLENILFPSTTNHLP